MRVGDWAFGLALGSREASEDFLAFGPGATPAVAFGRFRGAELSPGTGLQVVPLPSGVSRGGRKVLGRT